jgi:hypothetical protein
MNEREIAEYEREREKRYGQGTEIDEWEAA